MDTPQNMKLGHVKDLPARDMEVVKAGDWEILLKNLDNAIYALNNYCTHGAAGSAMGN